jgi:hypothetical protein
LKNSMQSTVGDPSKGTNVIGNRYLSLICKLNQSVIDD